ncbi:MAG: L-aspartate oxidase [Candidatus Aminicenantia bacterium]
MNKGERFETDVLIIGCGIAGASTALELAKQGLNIIIVTREKNPLESNTFHAQGGIVVLGEDDSPELLKKDIIDTGDWINNPQAVDILVTQGKELVEKILMEELKVPFSRKEDGSLDYAQEASHSRRRIIHVKDATGQSIEERFISRLKEFKNVTFLTNHTAVDLLTIPHHSLSPIALYREPQCIGAYILDNENERVNTVFASYTILATGGLGRIFLHTSNPEGARGDGYAMAFRAGARITNMEYIQFHPTSLFHRDAERFLISETLRGEGAQLKTKDGRLFMKKYSPNGDLAPRDEVTRAIYEEMIERGDSYVLLDLASYTKINIKERFPTIYQTCLNYGIDITKEPIPVVPAAHYCCGGVMVDEWGESSLKKLFAVGEVSCTGVHGANRLASTSLLEGLVWGTRAAKFIAENFDSTKPYQNSEIPDWRYPEKEEEEDPALIHQDWFFIRSTMWNYAGIIRTQKRLDRAKADLEYLEHRIEKFYKTTRMSDSLVGLRHGIQVALLVTYTAIKNQVSRGAHFRKD